MSSVNSTTMFATASFIRIAEIQYVVMSQSILGRIWDRLATRYERDEDTDCCGTAVEEVSQGPVDSNAEDCCE
jgi:hypothetical protein